MALVSTDRTHYWPLPRQNYCAIHNNFLRHPPTESNDELTADLFFPCAFPASDAVSVAEALQSLVGLLVRAGLPLSTQVAAAYGIVATQRTDKKIAIMAVAEDQMQTALSHAHDLSHMAIN